MRLLETVLVGGDHLVLTQTWVVLEDRLAAVFVRIGFFVAVNERGRVEVEACGGQPLELSKLGVGEGLARDLREALAVDILRLDIWDVAGVARDGGALRLVRKLERDMQELAPECSDSHKKCGRSCCASIHGRSGR